MSVKFKPQLATNAVLTKAKFPCLVQKKWDGVRCIITLEGEILSRSLKPIKNPWLRSELAKMFAPWKGKLAFDGEIQVGGLFKDTQSFVMVEYEKKADFIYHVFDSPNSDISFETRHTNLWNEIADLDARVRIVPCENVDTMDRLMAIHSVNSVNPSLDGTVYRNPKSVYKYGKSTATEGQAMKIKDFDDDEAVITGFEERMKNTNVAKTNELGRSYRADTKDAKEPTGLVGIYLANWNGMEIKVTAGGPHPLRQIVWENQGDYLGKLVKFQYMGLLKHGKPRHPTFIDFRDKDDL